MFLDGRTPARRSIFNLLYRAVSPSCTRPAVRCRRSARRSRGSAESNSATQGSTAKPQPTECACPRAQQRRRVVRFIQPPASSCARHRLRPGRWHSGTIAPLATISSDRKSKTLRYELGGPPPSETDPLRTEALGMVAQAFRRRSCRGKLCSPVALQEKILREAYRSHKVSLRRLERWLSGLKRTPGKREWANTPPGVQISLSPPKP